MGTSVRRAAPTGALWAVAVVVAALVGARFPLAGSASSPPEPARVCSVDLERVFDSAPQRATMEEGLVARDAQIREEIESKKKEIDRMKGELDLVRPGTEDHSKLQRELVQKQADLRFVSEQYEEEMERRVLELRDQLLGEIDKVEGRPSGLRPGGVRPRDPEGLQDPEDEGRVERGFLLPAGLRHHRPGHRRPAEGMIGA
jgi:Skp family chaperone for outer membrane proteins